MQCVCSQRTRSAFMLTQLLTGKAQQQQAVFPSCCCLLYVVVFVV